MSDHRNRARDEENTATILSIVQAAGTGLEAEKVVKVLAEVTTRPNARTRLRNSLEASPNPLTSGDPLAPRQIQRFLRALIAAGADGVRLPACQVCSSTRPVEHSLNDGRRVCSRCHRTALARPCAGCGNVRYCANRLDGQLVCTVCYGKDDRNKAACASCGKLGRPVMRTSDGVLCDRCAPRRLHCCYQCRQDRPAVAVLARGPICDSCHNRLINTARTCPSCASPRILAYLDETGTDVCARCAGQPAKFACDTCGSEQYLVGRRCARCVLNERTAVLFTTDDGTRPELECFQAFLLDRGDPRSTLQWFNRTKAAAILRSMAEGYTPVTHEGLDTFPRTRHREFLRDMLISAGLLEPLPRQLRGILEWIDTFLDTISSPDRQVLVVYTRWTITRRLRARAASGDLTESTIGNARTHLHALNSFLDWLTERSIRLGDAQQAHIDEFLIARPIGVRHLPQFLGWAHNAGHCRPLTSPTHHSAAAAAQGADHEHWALVKLLLNDESIRIDTRISGLFVLLYGQQLSHICRLTRENLEISNQDTTIRFATDPIKLPPGLDDLLRRHIDALDQHPATRGSPWLFPGRPSIHPIVEGGLGVRLKQIGIAPRTVRTTAMIELAAQLPAAVLAGFVGIDPGTAVAWNKMAGRDWSSYPALRKHQDRETNKAHFE